MNTHLKNAVRCPHVGADKLQPLRARLPKRMKEAKQRLHPTLLPAPQQAPRMRIELIDPGQKEVLLHMNLVPPDRLDPVICRWASPYPTTNATARATLFQLVQKTRAVSTQESRRAHLARKTGYVRVLRSLPHRPRQTLDQYPIYGAIGATRYVLKIDPPPPNRDVLEPPRSLCRMRATPLHADRVHRGLFLRDRTSMITDSFPSTSIKNAFL